MKISCIICAYNEEKTIASVLSVVTKCPAIGEVIVVNDGSKDATEKVVQNFPTVHLISHSPNQGKSKALATGLAAAQNELVMLLDADLVGLTVADVEALAAPVLEARADVTMSIRKNSLRSYHALGVDFVSGERVFPRTLLSEKISEVAMLPRFGFEVFLNNIFISQKLRVAIVNWKNVSHVRKAEKIGFWKGQLAETAMLFNIMKTVSPFTIAQQIKSLRTQRVK